MENCVFCKIANGQTDAKLVHQDDEVTAFWDVRPVAPIHILIISREHLESLESATTENRDMLGKMVLVAKKIAEEFKINLTGYRLTINTGKDAGQTVPHLHMHLIGGRKLP